MGERTDSTRTTAVAYVLVVVVAVLIGSVFAPVAWDVAADATGSGEQTVAVVTVQNSITTNTADGVREDLRHARQNESIEAVVLKVNSPGGAAAASEQLYLAVNRTAREMPVVAAVTGTAASGAYYTIAPADDIFVTPAAQVGSVGAYATASPTRREVPDNIVRSAPDKATVTRDQVAEQIETIQQSFLGTIVAERGDEIELSRNDVAHARIYTGARSVDNGMADSIGGTNSAVARAAELADLGDDFDVHYVQSPETLSGTLSLESDDGDVVVETDQRDDPRPIRYYAMWGYPDSSDNEVIVNGTQ